jgi:cell division protein FtsB
MTKELNELRSLKAHTSGGDQSRLDVEAQLAALRAEKDRQIEELNAEKERLQSQIEQLQNVRKQSFIRCTVF